MSADAAPAPSLFHILTRAAHAAWLAAGSPPYAPDSLAREGFIHASYREAVAATARLYFSPDEPLVVWEIDPSRLDVPVAIAMTPRGPMPHIHGAIPGGAIVGVHALAAFAD